MYIHPGVQQIDMRIINELLSKKVLTMEQCDAIIVTHMIIYATDLPKCFILPDAGDNNPYHVLFYMIARFYFVDNEEQIIHYYYPKRDGYLIEKALACLPARFIRHKDKSDTSFEYIDLPSCLWYNDYIQEDWIYRYIKNLYKPIWATIQETSKKKICISRQSASLRKLEQEGDLVGPLKERGFSFYDLDRMTFEDQIKLFFTASVVIGAHGAGLSWIAFCEKETRICEIAFENRMHYKSMADQCELRWTPYKNCTYGEKEVITLSVDDFLEFIDRSLLDIA